MNNGLKCNESVEFRFVYFCYVYFPLEFMTVLLVGRSRNSTGSMYSRWNLFKFSMKNETELFGWNNNSDFSGGNELEC